MTPLKASILTTVLEHLLRNHPVAAPADDDLRVLARNAFRMTEVIASEMGKLDDEKRGAGKRL